MNEIASKYEIRLMNLNQIKDIYGYIIFNLLQIIKLI